MKHVPDTKENLEALVGAIVLKAQETERAMKLLVTFADGSDPTTASVLARHKRLKRSSFGNVLDSLMAALSLAPDKCRRDLRSLVTRRNAVVHQFDEKYGPDLRVGRVDEVTAELRKLLADIESFRRILEVLCLGLIEAMHAGPYANLPEDREFTEFLETFRKRVGAVQRTTFTEGEVTTIEFLIPVDGGRTS